MAPRANLGVSSPPRQTTIGRRGRGAGGMGGGGRRPGNRGQRHPPPQGAKRPPNQSVFSGKQGEALTNQAPEQYINALLTNAGWMNSNNSLRDQFAATRAQAMVNDYWATAQNKNQNLSVMDYMRQKYGAQMGAQKVGKKGHKHLVPESMGTLAQGAGGLDADWNHFRSNEDTAGYVTEMFGKQGGVMPGSTDFTDYVNSTFIPSLAGRNPTGVDFDTWYAQHPGLLNSARVGFKMRPGSMRNTTPVSPQGRYSWWA